MPLPKESAWFVAKTYGWGWGWPRRWEGWVAFLVYFTSVVSCGFFLVPRGRAAEFVAVAVVLTLALLALCWWKGEKPQWRWGDQE